MEFLKPVFKTVQKAGGGREELAENLLLGKVIGFESLFRDVLKSLRDRRESSSRKGKSSKFTRVYRLYRVQLTAATSTNKVARFDPEFSHCNFHCRKHMH